MQILVDGVHGASAAAAVALMRAVAVVVGEPAIKVQLEAFDGLIEGGAEALRKNSLRTVRWKRSTKPLVCGRRTRVVRCSISASAE